MDKTKPPVYVETITGKIIDLNADKYLLDVEDIAIGLANIKRFNGRTGEHWSVGQHSLTMFRFAQERYPEMSNDALIAILLHDASEALTGDIITPVKNLVPELKDIEAGVQRKIYNRFKVYEIPQELKYIDQLACFVEWVWHIGTRAGCGYVTCMESIEHNAKAYGFDIDMRETDDYKLYMDILSKHILLKERDTAQDFTHQLYQHLATYGE